MTEVQPICVMYYPPKTFYSGGVEMAPNDLMSMLNGWDERMEKKESLGGYLWLVFYKTSIEAPEIQYINTQGLEPVQYEEIIKLIKENSCTPSATT